MRERAAESAADCAVTRRTRGGARVLASLPMEAVTSRPGEIVVADDHPLYRRGLAAPARRSAGLVGSCRGRDRAARSTAARGATARRRRDGPAACPNSTAWRPPGESSAASPHIAVLILTMFDDDASVFAAMRAGARGYLLKGADQAEIVRAVAAVGSG